MRTFGTSNRLSSKASAQLNRGLFSLGVSTALVNNLSSSKILLRITYYSHPNDYTCLNLLFDHNSSSETSDKEEDF